MQMTTTVTETKRKPLNIVVIGLPGCGKGTQSKRIAEHYNLVHVSSGELLRRRMQSGTPTGCKISKAMEDGNLISDDLVDAVFAENVPSQNYILDGYPRKLSQVDTFPGINLVIYLELPEKEVTNRLLNREDSRADDNEDTIRVRLSDFKAKTKSVVDFYADRGILHNVDAMGTPEEVFERIRTVIKDKLFE